MLSSFSIANFKSYRGAATLELAPLTVLIGANAAGKSNAVEALRLLSRIAAGDRLASIRHALHEQELAIRGSVSDLGFGPERAFSLGCRTDASDWNEYSIKLEVRDDDDLHIADERLTGPASLAPLFKVVEPSRGALGDMFVAYNNFARGGKKPQLRCSDQTAVLCQLMSSAAFYRGRTRAQRVIWATTRRLHEQLSTITWLDPRPSLMRGYSFKTERRLTGSGANLSGVLYNLCETEETRNDLLEFVRALPEQDIEAIDFIETPRGEAMVTLTETFGGRSTTCDATLLSDGTLRVLAIAAAILSAEDRLVVIEEIDNGVHPSRAEHLLERMSRLAKSRNLRILISSHNPALLDALPGDAVPHVVFCHRDHGDGSSRLIRLMDLRDYPELIARGSVGHLMTRGILERFVRDRPDPDERKERARAWLEDIRAEAG